MSLEQILLFLAAAALITLSPGPDVLATISIGLSRGWKPAAGFGIGCAFGCLFHTALATLGISALLKSSAVAFTLLKWTGAAYLAWLGLGAIRSRGAKISDADGPEQSLLRYFSKGLVANAINPKVALFFLSFLPQFLIQDGPSAAFQTAVLGGLFTLQAAVIFGMIGFCSGSCGRVLQSQPGISIWLDRIAGSVFLLLALKLVLPDSK